MEPTLARCEVEHDFQKTHLPTVILKLLSQTFKNAPTPAKTLELSRF